MTKILLVEDDKSLREIYGVRLLAEGYDIVSAGDGEEALAMAIKERPSLIISDVMMPKISGFDMLDILRSTTETRDIKVIIMTALSSEDQRARGVALGADKYLVKSQVGIEDVVKTVHDILNDGHVSPAQRATAAQPQQATASAPQPTAQIATTPNVAGGAVLQPTQPSAVSVPAQIQPQPQQPPLVNEEILAAQKAVAAISGSIEHNRAVNAASSQTAATPSSLQKNVTPSPQITTQQLPQPATHPQPTSPTLPAQQPVQLVAQPQTSHSPSQQPDVALKQAQSTAKPEMPQPHQASKVSQPPRGTAFDITPPQAASANLRPHQQAATQSVHQAPAPRPISTPRQNPAYFQDISPRQRFVKKEESHLAQTGGNRTISPLPRENTQSDADFASDLEKMLKGFDFEV